MTHDEVRKVQEQIKAQPGTSAAEICNRMGFSPQRYYNAASTLRRKGTVPKVRVKASPSTKPVKRRVARKLSTIPFEVATVSPAQNRARVFVVACWADEISAVMKGLQ